MKNTNTFRPLYGMTAASLMLGFVGVAKGAAVNFNNDSGTGNNSWSVAANWASGTAPWDLPSAPTDDLTLSAHIIVDSTETYTTGSNSGNPFQFRRKDQGSMTIVDGGTFDFGGGSDGRFLISATGNQLIMTGGTLLSDSGNLNGVNISGTNSLFQVGGSSTVNIFDPGGASQGVIFSGTTSKGMSVIGSNASISLEAFKISAGASNINLSFELDAGGASAVGVTDAITWDDATSGLSLNLTNPGSAWNGVGDLLLYDLANGSTGSFDSIVTEVGTYSALEGTEIQLNSGGPSFAFSYQIGDGNDIGLTVIPEPSALVLLMLGGAAVVMSKKIRRKGR